ncbi:MAG: N-acetyltransferase family protein [Flavobacteriales bacterium]|jgi:GNAT superfamily N-acetyltransferase|tara:strand:- start:84 stop:575 length:492 start_codon:yes stop_codon:yes gene_type:complete
MKVKSPSWKIRNALPTDVPAVHALIVELAIYERAGDEVVTTVESLLADGFGPQPVYELIVGECEGQIVGMALWYVKYSTWKGTCGFLEDLVVAESHRGLGMGKALFELVASTCADRGYLRMEWLVLDWNKPALGFYQSLGAELDPEWFTGKLTGSVLSSYASA